MLTLKKAETWVKADLEDLSKAGPFLKAKKKRGIHKPNPTQTPCPLAKSS